MFKTLNDILGSYELKEFDKNFKILKKMKTTTKT
jgi:hypothetical protein